MARLAAMETTDNMLTHNTNKRRSLEPYPCLATNRGDSHPRAGERHNYDGKDEIVAYRAELAEPGNCDPHAVKTTSLQSVLKETGERGLACVKALSFVEAVFPGSQVVQVSP